MTRRFFAAVTVTLFAAARLLSASGAPAFQMFATTARDDGSFAFDDRKPLLSVDRVQTISRDPQSGDYDIVLLPADAKTLATVTQEQTGHLVAITTDHQVIMVWRIRAPVTDGEIRVYYRPDVAELLKAFAERLREHH
jgi:preprotein translocase subunit SecD